jgi:hypothetical protein
MGRPARAITLTYAAAGTALLAAALVQGSARRHGQFIVAT